MRTSYTPMGVGESPVHDAQFEFEVLVVVPKRAGGVRAMRGNVSTYHALVRDRLDNHQLVTSPYGSSPLRPVSDEPRNYAEGFVGMSSIWSTSVQFNG